MRSTNALLLSLGLLFAAGAQATSPANPNALEAGHSAVWFDAENPGTGWVLELLEDKRGVVYWYGFDEAGQPVWQVGSGSVTGDVSIGVSLTVPELFAGSGARFGDEFDPDDVVLEPVPGVRFTFRDCESGTLTRAGGDGTAGSEPLNRLTETMGPVCGNPNGIPGRPVQDYAPQSGTWFNPGRDGEGISLQWMSRDEAVVYWFTYDMQGNPFWLFGVGVNESGVIGFSTLYSATRSSNGETRLSEWGSLSLNLSCDSGTLNYASQRPEFGAGQRSLQRLTGLAGLPCPYVMPRLEDLYTLSLDVLPNDEERFTSVWDIADNGTVVATEEGNSGRELVILTPGAPFWAPLGGPITSGSGVFLTPDSEVVFANASVDQSLLPFVWTAADAAAPIPDFGSGHFKIAGSSRGRTVLLGAYSETADSATQPWSWDLSRGLRLLDTVVDDTRSMRALAASDDGQVVLGTESYPIISTPGRQETGLNALRWRGESVEALFDPEGFVLSSPGACSARCDIIFGARTNGLERDDPRGDQAWIQTDDGYFERFGPLYDFSENGPGHARTFPAAASADGSLAAGFVDFTVSIIAPPYPPTPFLWTQATGLVELDWRYLAEQGLLDEEGYNLYRSVTAVSRDGTKLLLQPRSDRVPPAVLTLRPK